MSLDHFTRRIYQVRLGGRSVGIGRHRLHLGGGWYTVEPLSVLKVYHLHEAQVRAGVEFGELGGLAMMAKVAPLSFLRTFAPLFAREPIKPQHFRRASAQQLLQLSSAVEKANNFPYIQKTLTPKPGGGRSAGFDVWVVGACQILNRHLEDLLHLSFEQVAWHLEVLGRLQEESKPVGERTSRELSEDEVAELNRKLDAFGVEVVPDA